VNDASSPPARGVRAGSSPPAGGVRAGSLPAAGEVPLVAAWQQATHRLLAALDDALADLGLSAAEVNALACLGDGATVRDLVAATAQRPSTLTGVLDRLERRGLIERAANPADRRSVLVRLTPAGRPAAARVAEAFAALERRLPRDDVRRTLEAVSAALD
jgi:DNA-binding MarR family transcriptional regulator